MEDIIGKKIKFTVGSFAMSSGMEDTKFKSDDIEEYITTPEVTSNNIPSKQFINDIKQDINTEEYRYSGEYKRDFFEDFDFEYLEIFSFFLAISCLVFIFYKLFDWYGSNTILVSELRQVKEQNKRIRRDLHRQNQLIMDIGHQDQISKEIEDRNKRSERRLSQKIILEKSSWKNSCVGPIQSVFKTVWGILLYLIKKLSFCAAILSISATACLFLSGDYDTIYETIPDKVTEAFKNNYNTVEEFIRKLFDELMSFKTQLQNTSFSDMYIICQDFFKGKEDLV